MSKIPNEKNVKRNILKEIRKDNARILNSHLSNGKGRKNKWVRCCTEIKTNVHFKLKLE